MYICTCIYVCIYVHIYVYGYIYVYISIKCDRMIIPSSQGGCQMLSTLADRSGKLKK